MRRDPTVSEIFVFWTHLWEFWAITALELPAAVMRELPRC